MSIQYIKRTLGISMIGLAVLSGLATISSAQGNRGHDRDKEYKQQQKLAKQREKEAKRQAKFEQERLRAERARIQADLLRRQRIGTYGDNGYGYDNMTRYRVVRGSRSYQTDGRGADLLRQAVNQGYQQGYAAGKSDRNNRRRSSYSTQIVYRDGNYGYDSYVARDQYQYYFQQGFQRGYSDGFNSQYRYGTTNGGGLNILGAILGSILNIRSY